MDSMWIKVIKSEGSIVKIKATITKHERNLNGNSIHLGQYFLISSEEFTKMKNEGKLP